MTEPPDSIRIQLDGDHLRFMVPMENNTDKSVEGSLSSIRSILEKGRLTGVALENAINHTEDLIMPMLRTLPRCETLMVEGPELERVVRLLIPGTHEVSVSLDSVESLYRRLADDSQGSKTAWREEVPPEHVALGLVVLREVMQHGRFRFVSLFSHTS